MSMVLDALQKAEQDRQRSRPDLDTFLRNDAGPTAPSARSTSNRMGALVWLAALVVVGMVAYLIVEWSSDQSSGLNPMSSHMAAAGRPVSVASAASTARLRGSAIDTATGPHPAVSARIDTLVASLTVDGHLYVESNSAMSRAFINGQSFRVGDRIGDALRVTGIGSDSITLGTGEAERVLPIR